MKKHIAFQSRFLTGALLAASLLISSVVADASRATEMGTLIHFPAKMDENWAPAEAAAVDAAKVFGKGAWLRFDGLWHDQHFEPFAPKGSERVEKIVGLCKRHNLRPLMNLIPHPWPTSAWTAAWREPKRDWGDPDPQAFPWIARRYAETVAQYRAALKKAGIAEKDAAIQWGNEPAAGHPGGNGQLPQGTWSAAALWTQCNQAAKYGALNVVSPALSMQDAPPEIAARERSTAVIDAEKWSFPVTSWAFHNRVYRADLSGEAYADEYLKILTNRAKVVADVGWPAGDAAHAKSRARGLWVTEGYVAQGDAGGVRADAVRALAKRIKRGVPGVAVFIWYRWHPSANSDGTALQWEYDAASKAAIAQVVADKTIVAKTK